MNDNIITSAVIVGAGIFGVSTGVQLARRGVQVTIVNDGPPANGASGRSLSWLTWHACGRNPIISCASQGLIGIGPWRHAIPVWNGCVSTEA